MTRARGVVTLAALDLRGRPDHRSELRSQLLLGEVVRILARAGSGAWLRVENETDGYRGWARSWGVVESLDADEWRNVATARVARPYAEARDGPGAGRLVTPLFWNGRVAVLRERGGFSLVRLPDGRSGWVEASALRRSGAPPPKILARLDDLLGTPYLWGGRTPLGFDCSGLVQQVLEEQGVHLPRDAEAQHRASRPIAASRGHEVGDLVFFGRPRGRMAHVGILLGDRLYAHARGSVRVNSLDPGSPLCDKELLAAVRAFGRPPRSAAKKPVRRPHSY